MHDEKEREKERESQSDKFLHPIMASCIVRVKNVQGKFYVPLFFTADSFKSVSRLGFRFVGLGFYEELDVFPTDIYKSHRVQDLVIINCPICKSVCSSAFL